MRLRERFPGVDVTLDQSVYGGSSRASKKKRPPMAKSKTAPSLSVAAQSPLPPAVANVPKDDVQGYVHSKKVNNYLIGPTLGEGSFAKVKEAFHVLVGEKVRPSNEREVYTICHYMYIVVKNNLLTNESIDNNLLTEI